MQDTDSTEINHMMVHLYDAQIKKGDILLNGESFMDYCVAAKKLQQLEHEHQTNTLTKQTRRPWNIFSRNTRIACSGSTINIFWLSMNTKRTLQVDMNQTLQQICELHRIPIRDSWISFGGRPLNVTVPIREYDVCEGSTVIQNSRMLGGSTTQSRPMGPYDHRLYTHVLDCERQLLAEKFQLQAAEAIENSQESSEQLFQAVMKLLDNFKGDSPGENTWLFDLVENFFQIAYWTRRCQTKTDYITCTMLSYKLMTGKSVTSSIWNAFKQNDLQDSSFTKLTREARDMFSSASVLVNNPLLKKLRKIYTYLLVQGFLTHFGQEITVEEFLKLDSKVKVDYKSKTNLVVLIVDVAITICERIDAYRLTGDWHALLHEEATYTKWTKDAERLINLAPFTSNLAAHGTTYFTFVSDLNDTIEKGEAICRYSSKTSGIESNVMRKRLNSLQMLKNVEITRRASQKERKAPFGVLIHGGSSVAKSSFTKMLYYYYGKLHGLDTDDHYRYVRNPAEEYWNNFDSSKWCIQLDDIAFLLPAKSAEVDPTLKDLLNVVNNVPYVPPQAALEDKGKTPVMAKLVVATTNAADLNAQDYFHCPLAVRRRLPYVVHVRPKECYLAENGKFIDPKKLPPIEDAFPDYWIIEVQKLVPVEHNGRDSATFETVQMFSDVNQFLKHFAQASVAHETTQEAADSCDIKMKDVRVCRLCYSVGDECACLQAAQMHYLTRVLVTYMATVCVDLLSRLTLMFIATWIYSLLARYFIVRRVMAMWGRFLNAGVEMKIHSLHNRNHEYKFKIAVHHLLRIGLTIGSLYLTYTVTKNVWKATGSTSQPKDLPTVVDEEESESETDEEAMDNVSCCSSCGWKRGDDMCEQGNVLGTTEQQLKKEASQNVWYNPTIELSRFDVPLAAQSLAHLDSSGIRDLFAANSVRIEVHAIDVPYAVRMGAVYLKGQYLCFNRHAVKKGSRFRLKIQDSADLPGVTSNVEVYFGLSELKHIVERDLVVLKVTNAPPRKNILKYWNTTQIPVTRMVSVQRRLDGCVEYRDLFNVSCCREFPVEALNVKMDVYMGIGIEETKEGDCGSIGVAMTPQGPVILGLHTLGHNKTAGFPHVTRSQLEACCDDPMASVEDGGEPLLSLNGAQLVPPHHKSVIRYMDTGVARIYGSLSGPRARPKSRVCETPLQKEMLEHFGGEVGHGKPAMLGWEPIHKNVVEMVKPYTNIDQQLLDHCVEAYTADILAGLQEASGSDAWKGELVFLSDRAAVNGLPGVKFIDSINKSTSMGHPWHGPKKRFLEPFTCEEYPDGVVFNAEISARIEHIKNLYKEGKRAHPVFTAHLKDEAVTFAKRDAKKTRIFTGAPADWSIVVRSRLLSFVRLLQNNKFVFEAAPGTVAQSVEWTHFYNYLTKFGEDRMVGGDYEKYDKHMIPTFILAAFQVIVNIHKEAGFSDEELVEIYCIALDTAFPLTNVSGDIMEFNGTNPSGHPLTVIINSLVNSLYMRYAYCTLNPVAPQCFDFKSKVALLTYGDDNLMGVNISAPWFNHTAIQQSLATIGVGYTMAEKGAKSKPYITIQECSFLKRIWRFEEELGMFVCPLEEASIRKSLTVWVPSKTIDKYKQMVDVITSANSEYFFYGKEIFTMHHEFFQEILKMEPYSFYVDESTLPSWDDLLERFRRASERIVSSS